MMYLERILIIQNYKLVEAQQFSKKNLPINN